MWDKILVLRVINSEMSTAYNGKCTVYNNVRYHKAVIVFQTFTFRCIFAMLVTKRLAKLVF